MPPFSSSSRSVFQCSANFNIAQPHHLRLTQRVVAAGFALALGSDDADFGEVVEEAANGSSKSGQQAPPLLPTRSSRMIVKSLSK